LFCTAHLAPHSNHPTNQPTNQPTSFIIKLGHLLLIVLLPLSTTQLNPSPSLRSNCALNSLACPRPTIKKNKDHFNPHFVFSEQIDAVSEQNRALVFLSSFGKEKKN
jgi:hypothetical protein